MKIQPPLHLYSAITLAQWVHDGRAEDNDRPAIEHVVGVLRLLLRVSIDLPLETYVIALLHNALEDTRWGREDIERYAGNSIANTVAAFSKSSLLPSSPTRAEQPCFDTIVQLQKFFPDAPLILAAAWLETFTATNDLPSSTQKRVLWKAQAIVLPLLKHPYIVPTDHLAILLSSLERIVQWRSVLAKNTKHYTIAEPASAVLHS